MLMDIAVGFHASRQNIRRNNKVTSEVHENTVWECFEYNVYLIDNSYTYSIVQEMMSGHENDIPIEVRQINYYCIAKLLKLCTKLELLLGLKAITYMALTKLNLKTELSHKLAT